MTSETKTNQPILRREDRDGIATLTLNRPEKRNALTAELIAALHDALDAIAGDTSIKVVVIAGAGKVFCSGHDLKEMRADSSYENMLKLFTQCSDMMLTMNRLPQPVIAKVHAMATAAGCQIVAACDLAVASTEARFCTPGVTNGLFCSTPGVALSRAVNRKQAFEMLLTAEVIDAQSALQFGLVNRVVPPDELDASVDELARGIAARSSLTVAMGKDAFYRQLEMPLDRAYAMTSEVMARNMTAEDAAEGIDAFLEKRQPVWHGR